MYIFLDESKALHKNWWKFILAWLVTSLKPSTIDKIYSSFLEHSGIKEVWGELKSFNKKYRDRIDWFYNYLKISKYFNQIQFIWIYARNYKESWKNYYRSLEILLEHTIKYSYLVKSNTDSINIIADNIKINYSKKKIKNLLNSNKKISTKNNKWYTFIFGNSKRYWWIKFSDFIAWKLRETYISEKKILETDFIEYFVNEEISFIIL